MSLVDRLILRELLPPLLVGLLAILQLLVLAQLLQLNEVVFGGAVTLPDLGRVTLGLLPHFLVTALPLTCVLATLLGLGRLAADRELLALSAAGRSPLWLWRVPVVVSLLLAVGSAALARWAEPWGLRELNGVLNEVIKRNLEQGLLPGTFNDQLPRFMVYVDDALPGEEGTLPLWRGVLIEDRVASGAPLLALAEEGHVVDSGGDALTLELSRGELHRAEADGETFARFSAARFLVGVQERVARKNRFTESEVALTPDELRARAAEADAQGRRDVAGKARLELWRRSAAPLACLAFALLGVPLALLAGGARALAYVLTMAAFVSYYALGRVGTALAEAGRPAWLAAFLPTLLIAALGVVLGVRLVRRGVAS